MQGNDSYRLIVRRGPQPNQSYDLTKDVVTIGRDITNDIVINDPEVSRHHLRLTRGPGGYTLEDLGSTNGTFVSGQRLTGARALNPNDMIGLGETVTLGYEALRPQTDDGAASPGALTAPRPVMAAQPQPQAPQPAAPYSPGYNAPAAPYSPSAAPQPQPQQPSYSPSYSAPAAPPSYGAPYDEYDDEPGESRNTLRVVLVGCVGISVLCCCASVAGLVIVDQQCLWDQIPILSNVLNAFGYFAQCVGR